MNYGKNSFQPIENQISIIFHTSKYSEQRRQSEIDKISLRVESQKSQLKSIVSRWFLYEDEIVRITNQLYMKKLRNNLPFLNEKVDRNIDKNCLFLDKYFPFWSNEILDKIDIEIREFQAGLIKFVPKRYSELRANTFSDDCFQEKYKNLIIFSSNLNRQFSIILTLRQMLLKNLSFKEVKISYFDNFLSHIRKIDTSFDSDTNLENEYQLTRHVTIDNLNPNIPITSAQKSYLRNLINTCYDNDISLFISTQSTMDEFKAITENPKHLYYDEISWLFRKSQLKTISEWDLREFDGNKQTEWA